MRRPHHESRQTWHSAQSPRIVPAPFAPSDLLHARDERHTRDGGSPVVPIELACARRRRVATSTNRSGFLPEQFAEVWSPLEGVEFVNLAHGARVGASAPFGVQQIWRCVPDRPATLVAGPRRHLDTLSRPSRRKAWAFPRFVIAPTYYDWRYRWRVSAERRSIRAFSVPPGVRQRSVGAGQGESASRRALGSAMKRKRGEHHWYSPRNHY